MNDCEFSSQDNDEERVIENAQQHVRDAHGDTPTRDDVEQYVTGPG